MDFVDSIKLHLNDLEKEEKIIRNISKQVIIDKSL
jgi:hypothetical protein